MEVTTLVRTVGLDLLKPALPQRQLDGHKGTFGKLLIVGGAVGYTGAPYLTALSGILLFAGPQGRRRYVPRFQPSSFIPLFYFRIRYCGGASDKILS